MIFDPAGRTGGISIPVFLSIESVEANKDNRDNSYTFCSNMTNIISISNMVLQVLCYDNDLQYRNV